MKCRECERRATFGGCQMRNGEETCSEGIEMTGNLIWDGLNARVVNRLREHHYMTPTEKGKLVRYESGKRFWWIVWIVDLVGIKELSDSGKITSFRSIGKKSAEILKRWVAKNTHRL